MSAQKKPALSIGIIFKNEIRCIERCLKSLEPLRAAVPCELVMADTGSTDGSRKIAEKYADILFDFPWVNDFSAARNAVMDRSSGRWYMTIDCDEWLVGDPKQLITFVTKRQEVDVGAITVRNYNSEKFDQYSDFIALRLARLSAGIRYVDSIHENWPLAENACVGKIEGLRLDHDGYVANVFNNLDKGKRNMALLRAELEKKPEDLMILKYCIDSGGNEPDFLELLRRGVQLTEQKKGTWQYDGPAIMRAAVKVAYYRHLSKVDQWAEKAEELFPNALPVAVDVAYYVCLNHYNEKRYAACIEAGERYLKALGDYLKKGKDSVDMLFTVLYCGVPGDGHAVRTAMADSSLHEGRVEQCAELLGQIDAGEITDPQALATLAKTLVQLHAQSEEDTALLVKKLWGELNGPTPSEESAKERRSAFLQGAKAAISEEEKITSRRSPWGALVPLAEECDLGRAAAMLSTSGPAELERHLSAVERWDELPAVALAHALDCGARFPLADRPLKLEEMDTLAAGLTAEPEILRRLVAKADPAGVDAQTLGWIRAITLALVQGCTWEDEELDMPVARKFAEVERAFLPRCYSPEALTEDGVCLLPALHRFGFYCDKAFQALDSGDLAGCVRQLRAGLESSHGQKKMVEFLLARVEDMERAAQIAAAPAELRALADQVRTILARFSPDDPAVQELKQSEAYQKVAYLIEGNAVPVWGGLIQ